MGYSIVQSLRWNILLCTCQLSVAEVHQCLSTLLDLFFHRSRLSFSFCFVLVASYVVLFGVFLAHLDFGCILQLFSWTDTLSLDLVPGISLSSLAFTCLACPIYSLSKAQLTRSAMHLHCLDLTGVCSTNPYGITPFCLHSRRKVTWSRKHNSLSLVFFRL